MKLNCLILSLAATSIVEADVIEIEKDVTLERVIETQDGNC